MAKARSLIESGAKLTIADRERLLGHLEGGGRAILPEPAALLTKSPKVYIRDSGLLHHLLNISSADELAGHPSRGASWEGFVIEDVLRRERAARLTSTPWFWRTAAGAEVDLLLDRGGERVAIEIKAGRGGDARALRALRDALPDIEARRAWIVDQAEGVAQLGPQIARAGFAEVVCGTP